MASKPKKNSIVRIDHERKCMVIYGDLSDAGFAKMVELSLPDGYIIEQWTPEKTAKQVSAIKALSGKNDKYYQSILSDEELKIYKAIKNGTVDIEQKDGSTIAKKAGFAYARKWVEDGKQMDGDTPIVNVYKGTGDNKVKIGEKRIAL